MVMSVEAPEFNPMDLCRRGGASSSEHLAAFILDSTLALEPFYSPLGVTSTRLPDSMNNISSAKRFILALLCGNLADSKSCLNRFLLPAGNYGCTQLERF